MPSFLHAADIHLDSPLTGLERYEGAPAEEVREATRRAFENLVEAALERKVGFIVLAGDLYDGDWKDYRTALFFNAQMSILREAGIQVFVVTGNHDAASQITKHLRPPGNVTFFPTRRPETHTVEDLGVALHGQGYPTRSVSEDISAAYPARVPGLLNVGLLHTSLNGRPPHADYAPCTVDGLRSKGYAYWALGHVHAREVVAEDPWIVFPGNLQGRHAREIGAKGATLVEYEGDEIRRVEPLELDVLRWARVEVDASAAAGPEDAVDAVRAALAHAAEATDGRPLAARVTLIGASQAHAALVRRPERWTHEIRSVATDLGDVWVEKVRLRTRAVTDRAALRERDDAIGALIRTLEGLDRDPGALERYAEQLEPLRNKLPPDLVGTSGVPSAGDEEALKLALLEARELLITRLVEGGEA